MNLFKKKKVAPEIVEIVITEGVESTWHYHFSNSDNTTRSFCGKQTMQTGLPLSSWGFVSSHIGESYCKECEKLYNVRQTGE